MKALLAILILIPLTSYCQNSDSIKFRRAFIGLTVSPDYSYRTVKPIGYDDPYQNEANSQLIDSLNVVEKGKLAFTFGITLNYKINKRISLNTGFYYSDKGIKSKGFVYGNGAYYGYSILTQENFKESKFYYYEIPVSLSYSIYLDSLKKYQSYIFFGATFCLNSQNHNYISRRWYTITGDPTDENSHQMLYTDANSIFRIGYTAGLGFSLKATEMFNIKIEPVFKYYPYEFIVGKKSNSNNPTQMPVSFFGIKEKPYSVGCNIGFDFSF